MKQRYSLMVYISMLAAQGIVIGLIERAIPAPFVFAPGAKLGLANLITIIAIFTLSRKNSFIVVMMKLLVTTLLGGTLSAFFYGFAGTTLSYITMLLIKQLGPTKVSIIGVSTIGGVMHNVGQLLVASFIAQSWSVLLYLPLLSFSGIVAGFIVGVAGNFLLNKVKILRTFHQDLICQNSEKTWLKI